MTHQDIPGSVVEQYASAVLQKDAEALLSLYDDEARIFDLWSAWSYEGKAAWRVAIGEWFGSLGDERVRVEFDDVLSIVAEDLATVVATISYCEIGGDGTDGRSMENRLTWVLRRLDGSWRIVHEHTSAPVDAETGTATLERLHPE
ncbi:nuclear transport factor 2 family protein [Arthrobacter agilis]|uniref:YybH family protein n=1 Tax=Arthrobacter agilis TaxID=37921 RepID=UPI0023662E4D|nr:nuclear transport factor 2 family protein [Arthrobacter agilis]WDF33343.1 nuclear transport factor 2 family protein [Arthrobacter agilis]